MNTSIRVVLSGLLLAMATALVPEGRTHAGDFTFDGNVNVTTNLAVGATTVPATEVPGSAHVAGNLNVAGTNTALTFVGDGSGLTGVTDAEAAHFTDGNVLAPPGGYEDINVGALNVTDGLDVQNALLVDTVQASGAISAASFTGDGSGLTGVTDANAAHFTAGNVLAPPDGYEDIKVGALNVTAGLDVANDLLVDDVQASGHISAATFSGDGSQLTNLPEGEVPPLASVLAQGNDADGQRIVNVVVEGAVGGADGISLPVEAVANGAAAASLLKLTPMEGFNAGLAVTVDEGAKSGRFVYDVDSGAPDAWIASSADAAGDPLDETLLIVGYPAGGANARGLYMQWEEGRPSVYGQGDSYVPLPIYLKNGAELGADVDALEHGVTNVARIVGPDQNGPLLVGLPSDQIESLIWGLHFKADGGMRLGVMSYDNNGWTNMILHDAEATDGYIAAEFPLGVRALTFAVGPDEFNSQDGVTITVGGTDAVAGGLVVDEAALAAFVEAQGGVEADTLATVLERGNSAEGPIVLSGRSGAEDTRGLRFDDGSYVTERMVNGTETWLELSGADGVIDVMNNVVVNGTYQGDGSGLTGVTDADAAHFTAGNVLAPPDGYEDINVGALNVTDGLDVSNDLLVDNVQASGHISAAAFSGDGSQLTNLPEGEVPPLASVLAQGNDAEGQRIVNAVVEGAVGGADGISLPVEAVANGAAAASLLKLTPTEGFNAGLAVTVDEGAKSGRFVYDVDSGAPDAWIASSADAAGDPLDETLLIVGYPAGGANARGLYMQWEEGRPSVYGQGDSYVPLPIYLKNGAELGADVDALEHGVTNVARIVGPDQNGPLLVGLPSDQIESLIWGLHFKADEGMRLGVMSYDNNGWTNMILHDAEATDGYIAAEFPLGVRALTFAVGPDEFNSQDGVTITVGGTDAVAGGLVVDEAALAAFVEAQGGVEADTLATVLERGNSAEGPIVLSGRSGEEDTRGLRFDDGSYVTERMVNGTETWLELSGADGVIDVMNNVVVNGTYQGDGSGLTGVTDANAAHFTDGNVLAPPGGYEDINVGALNVTGGLDVQNALLVDNVQASGTINATSFTGDGSGLTGVTDANAAHFTAGNVLAPPDGYEDINVGALNVTAGLDVSNDLLVDDIQASGHISAATFSGDGSQLTNLPEGEVPPLASVLAQGNDADGQRIVNAVVEGAVGGAGDLALPVSAEANSGGSSAAVLKLTPADGFNGGLAVTVDSGAKTGKLVYDVDSGAPDAWIASSADAAGDPLDETLLIVGYPAGGANARGLYMQWEEGRPSVYGQGDSYVPLPIYLKNGAELGADVNALEHGVTNLAQVLGVDMDGPLTVGLPSETAPDGKWGWFFNKDYTGVNDRYEAAFIDNNGLKNLVLRDSEGDPDVITAEFPQGARAARFAVGTDEADSQDGVTITVEGTDAVAGGLVVDEAALAAFVEALGGVEVDTLATVLERGNSAEGPIVLSGRSGAEDTRGLRFDDGSYVTERMVNGNETWLELSGADGVIDVMNNVVVNGTYQGDGSGLTGVTDANAAHFTAGNVLAPPDGYEDINVGALNVTAGLDVSNDLLVDNVQASGHISAATFSGDGSGLTGVTDADAAHFTDGNVLAPPEGYDDINVGALNVTDGLDVANDLLVDNIQASGEINVDAVVAQTGRFVEGIVYIKPMGNLSMGTYTNLPPL